MLYQHNIGKQILLSFYLSYIFFSNASPKDDALFEIASWMQKANPEEPSSSLLRSHRFKR